MARRACKFARREGFANPGERILVVAGVPFGTPGATNMVRMSCASFVTSACTLKGFAHAGQSFT
jgi:hypothetical protein